MLPGAGFSPCDGKIVGAGLVLRHDGHMISVVIPTSNSERLLPRCFDSLITAAVRGVVREVIVSDCGSTDATLAIADAAGAHIVNAKKGRSTQLAQGAVTAKSDWLLFLHPETALEPGWEGHVTLEFSNTTPLPARIYANEGACQFLFLQGNEQCEVSYADRAGKYMGQRGVTLPKL